VPDDRQFGPDANLFADQNLVQMMHIPDSLIVERNNQIALAQSSAFRWAVFLD
jgi:hypothetical protein